MTSPARADRQALPAPAHETATPTIIDRDNCSSAPAGAALVSSVASLASASAVAAPSINTDTREIDPVFELIDRHRERNAAADAAHVTWQNALDARQRRPYHPLRFGARVKVREQNAVDIERTEQQDNGYVITCKANGRVEPIYAYSADEIEKNVPKDLAEPERNAWIAKHVSELDRRQSKLERRRKSTKFGCLEAAWIDAADLATDAAWELVSAVPTTLEGTAARLAYIRSCACPLQEIAGELDMIDALRNTTEAAIWDLAGIPAPASLETYFEGPEGDTSEADAEAA